MPRSRQTEHLTIAHHGAAVAVLGAVFRTVGVLLLIMQGRVPTRPAVWLLARAVGAMASGMVVTRAGGDHRSRP